jgi:hypothetical protein
MFGMSKGSEGSVQKLPTTAYWMINAGSGASLPVYRFSADFVSPSRYEKRCQYAGNKRAEGRHHNPEKIPYLFLKIRLLFVEPGQFLTVGENVCLNADNIRRNQFPRDMKITNIHLCALPSEILGRGPLVLVVSLDHHSLVSIA